MSSSYSLSHAEEPDVYLVERLFSSSLVAVVATSSPRTLR